MSQKEVLKRFKKALFSASYGTKGYQLSIEADKVAYDFEGDTIEKIKSELLLFGGLEKIYFDFAIKLLESLQ